MQLKIQYARDMIRIHQVWYFTFMTLIRISYFGPFVTDMLLKGIPSGTDGCSWTKPVHNMFLHPVPAPH